MSSTRLSGRLLPAAALGLAASLVACSASIPGGVGGVLLTLFVSTLVFGLHKAAGCTSATAEASTGDGASGDGAGPDATAPQPCLSQACLCMCDLPLPGAVPTPELDDAAGPLDQPIEVQRARARVRLGPRLPPDVRDRLG